MAPLAIHFIKGDVMTKLIWSHNFPQKYVYNDHCWRRQPLSENQVECSNTFSQGYKQTLPKKWHINHIINLIMIRILKKVEKFASKWRNSSQKYKRETFPKYFIWDNVKYSPLQSWYQFQRLYQLEAGTHLKCVLTSNLEPTLKLLLTTKFVPTSKLVPTWKFLPT